MDFRERLKHTCDKHTPEEINKWYLFKMLEAKVLLGGFDQLSKACPDQMTLENQETLERIKVRYNDIREAYDEFRSNYPQFTGKEHLEEMLPS